MDEAAKRQLIELVERGDVYGLILELADLRGGKITAEQVEDFVRRYANQKYAEKWLCAGISIRVGPIGSHITEMLVAMPLGTPDPGTAS